MSSFNLEKAIRAWRDRLIYRHAFHAEDIEELERHLRDDIAGLRGSGFSERDAFNEAVREIGTESDVEVEYSKVHWGKLKMKGDRMRELRWQATMIASYVRIAGRNLLRHKGYSAINICGLSVGLACCFLIYLFVRHEYSFDRYHEHADEIYRVLMERENQPVRARTQTLLAPTLASDYPFVEDFVRISHPVTSFVTVGDETFTETRVHHADSSVFDVFSFELVAGQPETALSHPSSIVLSESTAQKYFRDADPLGRTLIVNQNREMVVTGVVRDIPDASHFVFDILAPFSVYAENWGSGFEDWSNAEVYSYLRIPDSAAARSLQDVFPSVVKRHFPPDVARLISYRLQPMTDIHLRSAGISREIVPQGDIRTVLVFMAIGMLILLIACINFINLSTARASRRSREIGMRKVVGAQRSQLVTQFLGESVLVSLFALSLAVILIMVGLPVLNTLTGTGFTIPTVLPHAPGLLLLTLVVSILAGTYPAFLMSRFRPVAALKSDKPTRTRGVSLRNGLVVFQFAIAVVLVFGSLTVNRQLRFMRTSDMGFDSSRILAVEMPGALIGTYPALRDAISDQPGIEAVTGTSHLPPATWGFPGVRPEGRDTTFAMKLFAVDFDFIEIMGMEMAEGRSFSRAFGSDTSDAIILNETAVQTLGWSNGNAIGKRASVSWVNHEGVVVGVVRDFHFRSMRTVIGPAVFVVEPDFFYNTVVQVRPGAEADVLSALEEKWSELAPGYPFRYHFLEDSIHELYTSDARRASLIGYLTGLAIFLACLGLLGLATFLIERRTREIGIRKVLGASITEVATLLSRDFARLVFIALVVAVPVGYLLAQAWLQEFVYHVDVGVSSVLWTGLAVMAAALITVNFHTLKAAMADPVSAIRVE